MVPTTSTLSPSSSHHSALVGEQRHAMKVGGTAFLWLSFQTLGIIYSDIGTSPLYVLNGIWPSGGPIPSKEDVIGGVSAVIWSLALVPLIKYVLITLRFGTIEGEGGTFALFHGIFPPEYHSPDDDRTLTGGSALDKSVSTQSSAERLAPLKWVLLPWTLFGTALTLSDGMLTPAVSVTSAVGGIAVTRPSVADSITGISIAFLVPLFLVQQFGTHRLAFAFGPITCIWFLLLAGTGIANIVSYPGIFRAFDPSRAIMLFVRTRNYDYLAGILLAVTGCEALFANLGQFTMGSIQLTFAAFVFPSLVLAYLGQGAKLIADPENIIENVFYASIPGGRGSALFWIVYVVAILATMITASFSVVQQLINFRSLFPLRMVYTSEVVQGQIYIPTINYLMMIGTIALVGAFQNLTNLTNAYGFAVSTVMIITTTLVALQCHYVKMLPWIVAVAFFVIFGFIDALFWGASLKKVPHGAWVTLMLGVLIAAVLVFWTWAKGLEDRFDGANRKNLRQFLVLDDAIVRAKGDTTRVVSTVGHVGSLSEGLPRTKTVEEDEIEDLSATPSHKLWLVSEDEKQEKSELARLPICAVFHKLSSGRGVPHTFYGFLRQWPALPRVTIFLSVRIVNVPRVHIQQRYTVTKVRSLEGFYGVTYALGFRDKFNVQIGAIIDRICILETRSGANDEGDAVQRIHEIRTAAEHSTHIVPYYHAVSKGVGFGGFLQPAFALIRKIMIEDIYSRISAIFPEMVNSADTERTIHVGINATI
ncbi:hypothetical protein FRC03_000339 [Tulasnella sp. 419]|nr:hypothetical protein FRC03_000339 [Tulasnella sp. 419]